ncbi:MAG: hypothetical protein ACI87M_000688, partial [Yoonia sp.]
SSKIMDKRKAETNRFGLRKVLDECDVVRTSK